MEGNGKPVPTADDFLEKSFGRGGYLANNHPGYQPRDGQIALARAVDESICMGDHLLAEAGTATGKSFGYLVPATFHIAHSRRKVVVVTANIALTEQLIQKDIPFLAKVLPWKFSYSLMKGKNNFLCLDQMYESEANKLSASLDTIDEVSEIQAWARACIQGQGHGDMSELPFQPTPSVWRQFSVSNDECKGTNCQYKDECFALEAGRNARECDLVVTNYHLYFLHLKLKQRTGLDLILPEHDVLIWDECHRAPEIARTQSFGFRITEDMIRHAVKKLGKSNIDWRRDAANSLVSSASWFFSKLYEYKRSGKYKTRIKKALSEEKDVSEAWEKLAKDLHEVRSIFGEMIGELDRQLMYGSSHSEVARVAAATKHECERSSGRLFELRAHIEQAVTLQGEHENVYFLEEEYRGRSTKVFLLGQPIHVGGLLKQAVFDKMHSVICTSATMTTGQGFDYIASELGCEPHSSLTVESPFTWQEQAVLVLPDDVPDPKGDKDGYRAAVTEHVSTTVKYARGRTLGLFTSVDMVKTVFDAIRDKGKEPAHAHGYRLYKQGDMPKTKLIEAFKKDISSVLLGTESFWAGVDVPGEALSAVVIDRIPFPTPDDPILDAISEQEKNWFKLYSIPKAILQLKQGVGRLIRTVSDVGAIVILDPRMRTKGYGKMILRSLPPIPVHHDLESVKRLLGQKPEEMNDGDFFDEVFS